MDGRTLVVSSQAGDVIRPGQKKVVIGEGMPIKGMPSERGNLIVEFEIEFPGPEAITEEVKKSLEAVLPKVPEFVLPQSALDNFHDHVAVDYVERENEYAGREAYDSDDGHGHHEGGGGSQCAHQ
jgi:DnaJ-class molecular chaperone